MKVVLLWAVAQAKLLCLLVQHQAIMVATCQLQPVSRQLQERQVVAPLLAQVQVPRAVPCCFKVGPERAVQAVVPS